MLHRLHGVVDISQGCDDEHYVLHRADRWNGHGGGRKAPRRGHDDALHDPRRRERALDHRVVVGSDRVGGSLGVVDRRHALGDDDHPRGEPLPEKADRRLQRAPSGGIVEKADHGVADQLGVAPLVHQLLLVEAVGERRHDVGPSHDHGQRHKREDEDRQPVLDGTQDHVATGVVTAPQPPRTRGTCSRCCGR